MKNNYNTFVEINECRKTNYHLLFLFNLCILTLFNSYQIYAQNETYWTEEFTRTGVPNPCNLSTTIPTSAGGAFFNGNAGTWYGFNVYSTSSIGCTSSSSLDHVRFKNVSGVTDSSYVITPLVKFGIKELHFKRIRASRQYNIWVTEDESTTSTNWKPIHKIINKSSSAICMDTMVLINEPNAKMLKIVCRPGTDTDIDDISLTSFYHILAPPSAIAQSHCIGKTVIDLLASGEAGVTFNWYLDATTGTPLATNTPLTTRTYYVSQTLGPVESTRTAVIVTINDCSNSIISGNIFEDSDGGTITGTPLTVTGTYLSIFSSTNNSALPDFIVPVASITGAYTFPALAAGKYKIIIGTSAAGSATPSYPNVGNFSMTSSAEGEAGTMGDGIPDGITFVTISDGAPVFSGSRVRADASVSFAIKQLAPLPVRLISFSGKNTENGNELTWKTSSEVNFSHFEIERSENAKTYNIAGSIDGSKAEAYEFVDVSTKNSAYYRLKMVDADGTLAYSKSIFILAENEKSLIGEFYPNPRMEESANIIINSTASTNWTITSFDLSGKVLYHENKTLNKGENKVKVALHPSKGFQIVRFECNGFVQYRKAIN